MMNKTLHIFIYMLPFLLGVANNGFAQTQPKVQIFGNVYGGGELAQVVSPDDSLEEVLVEDKELNDGPTGLFNPHVLHKYTTYVRLGSDAEVYGRSFGGGRGHNDSAGPIYGRVIGQTDILLDGATVWSEIYGGGQMADVRGNTLLHFKKGKAGHNAFGGGLGVLTETVENDKVLPDNRQAVLASADVRFIGTVAGDGEMNDVMRTDIPATGNTFVVFDGSEDSYTHYEFTEERTIHRDADDVITKNADGKYYDTKPQYDASNPSQLFSINHNIYGGGMTASDIEGDTYVHIRYGMVNEDMLNYPTAAASVWTQVFKSVANAQFCVFGGGYGYHSEINHDTHVTMDVAGSGQYKYINEFTEWFATTGKQTYHWDTNTGTPEAIYNAADHATWSHGAPGRSAMDIVGGGYNGKVYGTTHVETSGDVVVRKVYGGGYYASVGNTEVTLKSGIFERVYGGGMIGNVYGTATLNFGQQGLSEDIHDNNLHLMVKDAVYGGNDVSGTVGTSAATEITAGNGVKYNVYTPVDGGDKGVRLNIYGGLVLGDVYGAGNGNHPGYTNPAHMDFNLSQHPSENYRKVIESGQTSISSDHFAYVYKYRPRTGRVVMNIVGNDGTDFNDDPQIDKVRIWGRTFGGGNSCNVGIWNGEMDDIAENYSSIDWNFSNNITANQTQNAAWHPGDNFQGKGTITLSIGSHVQLGNRNDSHETPNGLFMGNNGEHMVTQTTDPAQLENYHHFYHPVSHTYLPGFLVYDASGNDIGRKAGLKAFAGFINNILTWTDNVNLTIADNAKDVWMSNFVGGGYRGSMKAKSAGKQFAYSLPTGVTIGHSVVGGAFNAHIVYRIYESAGNGYAMVDGKYKFLKTIPTGWIVDNGSNNGQYLKALYEDSEHPDQITGILRYNFDGGIMGHQSSSIAIANGARCGQVRNGADDFTGTTKYDKAKALVYLSLRNKMDPVVTEATGTEPAKVHGGIVYGGCFNSGYIDGDVWVDYRCSLSPLCKGKDSRFFDKTNDEIYGHVDNLEVHNALNVFGAGYGADTHTMGDTYLRILHNGTSTDSYDYPFVYNVFGGGNMGTVAGNTNVYYNVGEKGTVIGSLYGGGYKGTIDGNTFVELAGGLIINAYGGSREANIGGATHVWAYDGANRPDGEDEGENGEKAPLLVGNIYGANDISGIISGGMEAKWSKSKWNALNGINFNSYVQVGGTEDTRQGYPLVGNIFAGGNGEKTTSGAAPDIAKTLLEINGGTTLRAFGGGNKATVTQDAYILVDAPTDVFTNYTFTDVQKKVLMQTVFKGVLNGYHWEDSKLVMDPYHVVKMYGGNNVATMAIQPKWNLKDGMLENVYSGGNMGDMTYYNAEGKAATTDGLLTTTAIGVENNADGTNANYTPRGLSITIDSPDINIKNLFGGCRLSNVVPGGYVADGTLAKRADFDGCENLYGATINIIDGNIENVYGGNDVGGKVYFGTNINISGGVLGNVYGSGNGDYLYRFNSEATAVTEQYNDEYGFFYSVPEKQGEHLIETAGTEGTATHKILTINRIRPAVDNTFINIAGMAPKAAVGETPAVPKRVAAVKGNIFMGGNATTITRDRTSELTFSKFKLGSYTTINGLFLGSDGHSYAQNEFIEQFAKLNGIEDMSAATSFKSGHETDAQHNPILLNTYLMAVDMQLQPKSFIIKNGLVDTYIGTFCGGGNRGSMLVDKTVEMNLPASLVIFDKIVAGCMDATVSYNHNGTITKSVGGYTRPLDIGHNNGHGNTKIKYDIASRFSPLTMDVPADRTQTNAHGDNFTTAMGKGFLYPRLNAAGDAYTTGCNIYGGCYQSGEIEGDVELNLSSNMLEIPLTNAENETKFKNAITNGETCFNIFGAGFGQDSHVWGNVHIKMDGSRPSVNNIFGGGRNGKLIGNTVVEIRNGRVYTDVVGGCYASDMYGSSHIIVGYPKYYQCNTSGEYALKRGDQWNADKNAIKTSVKYLKGDLVPKNVYDQIVAHPSGNASSFTEATVAAPTGWTNINIQIGKGIYGGGYSVANSTSSSAGSITTHKLEATPVAPAVLNTLHPLNFNGRYGLEAALNTVGYGGNSAIMVGDQAGNGTADHIQISTLNDGGIYGDGHLTFCESFRVADITGYGYNTGTPHTPRVLNTFQRLDLLDVNDCCLILEGAQDFATNQIDATIYSVTRIDELRLNSSLDASVNLTPLSNTNGTAAEGFSKSKVRNYIGFNKNVHYLGSIVTNDAFSTSKYHNETGAVASDDYKTKKASYISTYSSSAKDATATDAFKKRNQGTARNCVGINNGYCLRIQNLSNDGSLYYGPIVGVAEVKLLTLTQGEGGGYVYADNIHEGHNGTSNGSGFLNVSGNFVFPGVVGQGDGIADQFIVDDCFRTRYGSPQNITTAVNGAADEAHYWYVEGNKYFFNTALTGYTFNGAHTFNLTTTDPNVMLSGVENGSDLKVESVEWLNTHRTGYNSSLMNASSDKYEFDFEVGGPKSAQDQTLSWTDDMPTTTKTTDFTAKAYNSTNVPQFNIKLQDKVNNSGDANYINHLDEPETVKIKLSSTKESQTYEYTINLQIVYLEGPTYEGGVQILNCALPGERIGFSSDGIHVSTPMQLPITGYGWKIIPEDSNGSNTWTGAGVDIPSSQFTIDDAGGVTGYVPALYSQNRYNIAYTFTAGSQTFIVLPDQSTTTNPREENRMIVVHNYHKMSDISTHGMESSIVAGARIYINNVDDLNAFASWINNDKQTLGVDFVLQNNLALPEGWSITKPFMGTLHGDGYVLDASAVTGTKTLFGSNLTGNVYNLGMIRGTIASATGNVINSYVYDVPNDDFKYGKKAYELSHYYHASDASDGYIKGSRFAGVFWQYARLHDEDGRMLRTAAPNYGSVETHHNIAHTAAAIAEHDCLFFGQTLAPNGDIHPTHIADGGANRVYETEGYYNSKTADKFYYNTAAWAMQPGLTAVRFDNTKTTGEQRVPATIGAVEDVTRNLLVYEADNATLATGSKAFFHVKGSKESYEPSATSSVYTLADMALVDAQDFNAPYAFTATKASYERTPTHFVVTRGTAWESLCLPFAPATVKAVKNDVQKTITHFYGTNNTDNIDGTSGVNGANNVSHEYWLRELTGSKVENNNHYAKFSRPVEPEVGYVAYRPYIVSFPGEKFYEFNLTGSTIRWEKENAVITVTDDAVKAVNKDNYTYTGAFKNEAASESKYVLNSNGDAFVKNSVAIIPFRGYLSASSSGAKSRVVYIGSDYDDLMDGEDTEQPFTPDGEKEAVFRISTRGREVTIVSSEELQRPCYTAAGASLGMWMIPEGESHFTVPGPGIYILNGIKFVVK